MLQKGFAVLCALALCLSVTSAFATSAETGENVSTGSGTISVYGQPQYIELKAGQKLRGAALGDEATVAVAATIADLLADSNVSAWEATGLDPKAYDVIKALPDEEKGVAMMYLLGFYSDVTELPEDVAAVVAKLEGLAVANVSSTSITYEGKAAELRTITFKVTDKSGMTKYDRFNYVRITGENDWILVSANESVQ